jgi:hypothetical protein
VGGSTPAWGCCFRAAARSYCCTAAAAIAASLLLAMPAPTSWLGWLGSVKDGLSRGSKMWSGMPAAPMRQQHGLPAAGNWQQ